MASLEQVDMAHVALDAVANRTTLGTVHHGLARKLVREGRAVYPTYERDGQTWKDMKYIMAGRV